MLKGAVDKLCGENSRIINLFEQNDLLTRFASAPASSRVEYHSCEPGGLLKHTLNVLTTALELNSKYQCPVQSVVKVCVFHDLGKIGGIDQDMYVPAEEWQQKKGQLYVFNKQLDDGLNPAQRSIFLLQYYNFPLTKEEFVAILTHDGWFEEANRDQILMGVNFPLVKLIQAADQYSAHIDKI